MDFYDVMFAGNRSGSSGPSLPEVTSEDNGKVLGVVEGAWDKMDAPSDGSTVLVTGYRPQGTQNKYIFEKTQQEICEMIKGGKDVVILIERDKESLYNYERIRFVCSFVLGTNFYFINSYRSTSKVTTYITFTLGILTTSNSVSYTEKSIADPT